MVINVDGVFLGIRYCFFVIVECGIKWVGGGLIVNLFFVVGLMGVFYMLVYNVLKGVVCFLIKLMVLECVVIGMFVCINFIYLGVIDMFMGIQFVNEFVDWVEMGFNEVCVVVSVVYFVGYFGELIDIVNVVLFLVLFEFKFMIGLEVVVDGGMMVQ